MKGDPMRNEGPDNTGLAQQTGSGRPWWLNPAMFAAGSIGIGVMLLVFPSASPLAVRSTVSGASVDMWSAEAWSQGWSFVLASGLLFVLAAANLWVLLRRGYGPAPLSLAWAVVAISGGWLAIDILRLALGLPRGHAGAGITVFVLAVATPLMWRRNDWPRRRPSAAPTE